ncbi:MAG: monovalent cation/H+ antiporter complex subunit F [Rickettsiaceae bacterium]
MINRDIFTKLLFLNTGTSLASLFICLLGSYQVNNSYIDIALIYFLLSTIATSAYLKYFIQKSKRGNNAP